MTPSSRAVLVSLFLALPLSAGAAGFPAGYGVGRGNEPSEFPAPAQVDYTTVVAPRPAAPPVIAALETPMRVQNTYVVTTTLDSGPGSLRAAITSANSNAGLDFISFAISGGGYQSISPTTQLPDVTDPLILDGTTQPGYAGTPIIELSGAAAGGNAIGLVIQGGNSTVRGLIINRWATTGSGGFGIVLDALGNNVIEGCWIGTDASGFIARPNAVNGIAIFNASTGNRIGGTTAQARNVLSGNTSSGIQIGVGNGGFNTIQGNWIGLNAFGTGVLPNGGNGIFLDSSDNTIGGKVPGARNVISGNALPGIFIGLDAQRTIVQGNYIGTDPTGNLDFGNQQNGVNIDRAKNNVIGDTTPAGRNVIGGNEFPAVYLFGTAATGNVVQGNFLCTDAAGSGALGDGNGVVIEGGSNNVIGGTTVGARNVIGGSNFNGIQLINGANQNRIIGNYIGTDSSGTSALPVFKGVAIVNTPNNTVGGTGIGEGNLISGNTSFGVEIRQAGATGNKVQGNRIGTNVFGGTALPNGADGVVLSASSNFVNEGNTIAFNQGAGVWDSSGTKNLIEKNSIFQNAKFGIDNFPRGLTINDSLDADTGANDLQNFPILDSATVVGTDLQVFGRFNSHPSRSYRINLYDNLTCGTSHFGEGRDFRASQVVTTDLGGNAYFIVVTPGIIVPNYITATATDVLDGSTSEFSQCLCTKDSDGDGLFDCWETQNWGIDINSDGVIDLDLYARGARSNHKDIFIELDAMNDQAPPPQSIQMVIDAFATAPQAEVQNPDGLDGINLHAALDETNITEEFLPVMFAGFDQIKDKTFGTMAEKTDPNHRFILGAKRLAYRYGMWVRTFCEQEDSTGGGVAELSGGDGGDDFVIALGSTGACGWTNRTDPRLNAGAFMHELGHTLGLFHGGGDNDQYKPNYYSVMNYAWAYPRPEWQAPSSWRLDYSHAPLGVLVEQVLDESVGLQVPANAYPIVTVPYTDANHVVRQARLEPGAGVDWNGDGTIASYVRVDVNSLQFGATGCDGVVFTDSSSTDILAPYSDWANLKYNFRKSEAFRNPAVRCPRIDMKHASTAALNDVAIELTARENEALNHLPPPRPAGKFVMDGALDPNARPLASNGGITLYGTYNPPQLYLATNAAAAQGADMVVLLSDARGTLRAAPLGKAGQAGAWSASLFGRSSGDPSAWADAAEAPLTTITTDSSSAVLEGVIDLGLLYGANPPNVYLALAKYAPGSGGALLAQAPAGNGDGNVDGAEFLPLGTVVGVDPVAPPAVPGMQLALLGAQPSRGPLRVRLTLGASSAVDVALQTVAGRRIATIAHGQFEAGVHDFDLDQVRRAGSGLPSGIYFVVARSEGKLRTTRVVLLR
ncbi:MAG: hypothetical protein ABI960_00150 [Candidatus Eisenbacteria bacterium]